MAYLTEKEIEFYEWLDQCPVTWFMGIEEPDYVSYTFILKEEDADE
mgnify:FL=1|tara:strand:+ start:3284 stop:3421 length:138 start_codon:yes stop_codon:yes gene_type:complete